MAAGLPDAAAVAAAEAGSTVTLDLGALVANWRLLRTRAEHAECAAVLKANAYGQGLESVAPALLRAGCRTFFVAHLFEGRRLRAVAPDATVYVLNGLPPGTAALFARDGLRPVLNTLPEIAEWREAAGPEAPACAVQVDTGMNRVGLAEADLAEAAALTGALDVALVMSHLMWSGHPADAARIGGQVTRFAAMREAWPGVPASLANSLGIFSGHRPHYDLVRPGYALFGGNPTPDRPNPMQAVVGLEATIVQVHPVGAGESVGYDGCWTAPGPRLLATISAGYADGIPRAAGGDGGCDTAASRSGMAMVHGVPCPFVGRVSMDLIVLDVTDVPAVARGDSAVLLGADVTVDDLAERAGTIGYEVLTKLGLRSHRRLASVSAFSDERGGARASDDQSRS